MKLTQKQAWLRIAEEYDTFAKTGESSFLSCDGLCVSIDRLKWKYKKITEDVYKKMDEQLLDYLMKVNCDGYLYDTTQKYAKRRANLARKFAKECPQ